MPLFFRIRKLIFLFTFLTANSFAHAQALSPDVLVEKIVAEVMDAVHSDPALRAGNREKVVALAEAKILPHIDFKRLTRLAVGKYWREANNEQREQITQEFRRLLIRTYSNAIESYKGQTLVVDRLRIAPAETDVRVHSKYLKPGAAPIAVEYAMEKTPDGWKIYDIVVEGVSLATTYRSEFGEAIQRSGLDGLVAKLKDKNWQNQASTRIVN